MGWKLALLASKSLAHLKPCAREMTRQLPVTAMSSNTVTSQTQFSTTVSQDTFIGKLAFSKHYSFITYIKEGKYFSVIYTLMENTPLVKFIQNYIQDAGGIFSIFSLVRYWWRQFLLSHSQLCKQLLCPYNKKKITQWLEDMNFILIARWAHS